MQALYSQSSIVHSQLGRLIYHYRVDRQEIRGLLTLSRILLTLGMIATLLMRSFYPVMLCGLLALPMLMMVCWKQDYQLFFYESGVLEYYHRSMRLLVYEQIQFWQDVFTDVEGRPHKRFGYRYRVQIDNRRKLTIYEGHYPWHVWQLLQQKIWSV